MFMNFGAVPPEINALRLYTGPGPSSLLAASTAWQGLAKELSTAAAAYQSQVSNLASGWHGVSSQRMAAAAAPHIQWLHTASAQAGQVGMQAAAQAAAYETAFGSMVPPPVVAANRSLKMALLQTNFLNRNAPAIMATDAAYMEMWEQNAATMYGYAATTQQNSVLPQFNNDKENVNPTAQTLNNGKTAAQTAGRAAADNTANSDPGPVQDYLESVVKGYGPTDALNDGLEPPYRLAGIFKNGLGIQKELFGSSSKAISDGATGALGDAGVSVLAPGMLGGLGSAGAASAGPASAPITAGLGNATRLGGLSVPGGWPGAPKALGSLAAPNLGSGIATPGGAGHMLGGVPLTGAGAARGLGDGVLRVGSRSFTMPRPLSAG
ncbi:PPE family protein [Mycolicibacillus trivialis]